MKSRVERSVIELKALRLADVLGHPVQSIDALASAETASFSVLTGTRDASCWRWFGFASLALVLAAFVAFVSASRFTLAVPPLALTADRVFAQPEQPPNRLNCGEIGTSDLYSPAEGVWFLGNCVAVPEAPLVAPSRACNRTSLDSPEFVQVSPDLYVFHQTGGSLASLWYASAASCFDLVSQREVSAVCSDEFVSFEWTRSTCSSHGGVLLWLNGR